MSGIKHVNKIPTIRGTDIMRDPRLNKVIGFVHWSERAELGLLHDKLMIEGTTCMKVVQMIS